MFPAAAAVDAPPAPNRLPSTDQTSCPWPHAVWAGCGPGPPTHTLCPPISRLALPGVHAAAMASGTVSQVSLA